MLSKIILISAAKFVFFMLSAFFISETIGVDRIINPDGKIQEIAIFLVIFIMILIFWGEEIIYKPVWITPIKDILPKQLKLFYISFFVSGGFLILAFVAWFIVTYL